MKQVMSKKEFEQLWLDMPEYNNKNEAEPEITVTFKFKTQADFEEFNKLLKENIYKCNKVFDGMQRKFVKQAWFPLKEKGTKYNYV